MRQQLLVALGVLGVLVEDVHQLRLARLELALDQRHEVGHRGHVRDQVDRDVDLEPVLDLHDQVHGRHGVDVEIGGEVGRRDDRRGLAVL